MTKDTGKGADREAGADDGSHGRRSLERLTQDLAGDPSASAELKEKLAALNAKLAEIEAGFDERLTDAEARASAAEAKITEQRTRLESLGSGREETMRALSAARDELARMAIERDELRKQLVRIEGLQTETITLPDEEIEEGSQIHEVLPSIEELMASLSSIGEASNTPREAAHLHTKVEDPDDGSQEMIAPELVFPEQYEHRELGGDPGKDGAAGRVSKILVLLDAEPPIKYPIYKGVMTIGRADSADIRINSDYVSRVHARIVLTDDHAVIEDVHSKNGIRVNTRLVARHELRHGDMIAFGTLRFTFIDTDSTGMS
jgi:FHA domain